jgi:hypothetical protein
MNSKLNYLLHSITHAGEKKICPFCGSEENRIADRKYIITTLVECSRCHLYFRHPSDGKDFNKKFYQEEYEERGITTDLPDPAQMQKLKADNFRNSEKNYQEKIDLIHAVVKDFEPIRIVDYGSSWGYASFQFRNADMSVQSLEISASRAKFGNENLGLNILTDENSLRPGNDVFFSSHVIEHHPDIRTMTELAKKLLVPEGFYIAFCPNASDAFRKLRPESFHKLWGLVHPNYLSDKFFAYLFSDNPYFIGSNPYDLEALRNWDKGSQVIGNLQGVEIFIISRPNMKKY